MIDENYSYSTDEAGNMKANLAVRSAGTVVLKL